jgi:regulator of protease activity HflC (stomatin/prohibitin superfamily)
VKDAIDEAISAQEDEERFIREAEAYAREVEPKARGQVKRWRKRPRYKQQSSEGAGKWLVQVRCCRNRQALPN